MKKTILGSIILSLFLLFSCKDNYLNNPVSPDQGTLQKSTKNIKTGTIKLDRILELPGLGNTYYQINGIINYKEELFPQNLSPTTSKSDVNLDIAIDATLINPNLKDQENRALDVLAESDSLIYIPEEGIYLLEKTYPVQGTKDKLELVCTYLVTTDNV
ncbi:MAG: hypothetical protein OQK29_04850, partial [Ignavibacteriaceae bacterium]|nr:hypothetical protein [Ignavibacteriaceae bacterium]